MHSLHLVTERLLFQRTEEFLGNGTELNDDAWLRRNTSAIAAELYQSFAGYEEHYKP